MSKYFMANPATSETFTSKHSWLQFLKRSFAFICVSEAICWPMLLSTFSHYSSLHIFANMFVLHSFCNTFVISLGYDQALGVYLSAGVLSSFASYFYKMIRVTPVASLGAVSIHRSNQCHYCNTWTSLISFQSGAIMAILAYICSKYPDGQLSIIFLPMFKFSAAMVSTASVSALTHIQSIHNCFRLITSGT